MVPDSPALRPWPGLVLAALVSGLSSGCAPRPAHEMLNAVLWQQHSAEYRALALQSYAIASQRLDEALATPGWSAVLEQQSVSGLDALPPAVVMDLDETVIDNARYEARIVTTLADYSPQSFAAWCESGGGAAVPGAAAFIASARERGVRVFFYTSRESSLRGCTRRTLDAILPGPVAGTDLFLRGDGSKAEIRQRLSRTHRIVLLVGDNLEDFVDGSKADAPARKALVQRHAAWFGVRWIVIANPVYGHWEALYYDYDHRVARDEKLVRKRSALVP